MPPSLEPTFRGHAGWASQLRTGRVVINGMTDDPQAPWFKTLEEAVAIGNDTVYGLGAGVWSRNINNCYRVARAIKAGRCWTNCYHVYPAGAAFGGYKESGFGRETHKQMLEHYQQTKNVLVSYSTKAMGFF
jgi:aldehyde dehydrogenase